MAVRVWHFKWVRCSIRVPVVPIDDWWRGKVGRLRSCRWVWSAGLTELLNCGEMSPDGEWFGIYVVVNGEELQSKSSKVSFMYLINAFSKLYNFKFS